MKRIATILLLLISGAVMRACAEDSPAKRLGLEAKREGDILVVGEGATLHGFADVLGACGYRVASMSLKEAREAAAESAPALVVLTPVPCEAGMPVRPCGLPEFGHWKKSRVLAMGTSGASFLEEGRLLIGMGQAWHSEEVPVPVQITKAKKDSGLESLLDSPCKVEASRGGDGNTWVCPHQGPQPLARSAVYDGGEFPEGTVGIGMEYSDGHHWLIAKQGDYVLWGMDSTVESLTDDGLRLFVNLCDALLHVPHEEVVFPAKKVLEPGTHDGTLKQGYTHAYWVSVKEPGTITLKLTWEGKNTMRLSLGADYQDGCFADGAAPLTARYTVAAKDAGTDLPFEIQSFDLPVGGECKYHLEIDVPKPR